MVKPSAVMRAEPNLNSRIIAELPFGTKVEIKERYGPEAMIFGLSGNWTKVQYKQKVGWVFDRLLSSESSMELKLYNGQLIDATWQIDIRQVLNGNDFYAIAPKGLILRSEPRIAAKVLTKIPYGEVVVKTEQQVTENATVDGITTVWVFVEFKAKKGYVWSGFLSQLPPPPTTCEDMEHYLITRLKPERDAYTKQVNETTWLRDSTYSPSLQFKGKYGMHSKTETLIVPSTSDAALFFLFRICTEDLTKMKAVYSKKNELSACYTEGGEGNSIPSGYVSLTIRRTSPEFAEVIRTSHAHERCPKAQ